MSVYLEQEQPYVNSAARERRKKLDQRRMAFRRAIEHYAEQRELQHALSDYPELIVTGVITQQTRTLRSAQPGC
ncbi:transcriptional regulator [Ectopseudomonas mendocina]|uniref:Transcriptional regulator n=1 Tax=Ectopseudomonas mendocina TaxID=300 RepID=A0ABZ2RGR9_ECTME